ncbi:MAG: DUF6188 family protein [Pseudonocardiaceae bacterium]
MLGVPFRYLDGTSTALVDAEDAPTLEPIWRVLRRHIVNASADEQLNLLVALDDGAQLSVDRSDQWEAWERHGKGVTGILAGPR